MRVRVKICGITSVEDGLTAVDAGCDAIGLMFYSGSTRAVDVGTAARIAAALPPFVTKVGVFADPAPSEVASVLENVRLDVLQFHGDETPDFCTSFATPFVKAAQMRNGFDFDAWARCFEAASALLLDGFDATQPDLRGGTGSAFDWSRWPGHHKRQPLILAGGLTPGNVGAAIRATRPYAVDVSGGVESRVKGVKDAALVRAFLAAVENEDRHVG